MERIMEKLWGKMLGLYGRQWEASYGHVDGEAFRDWTEALQSVKLENIQYGVQQLINEGTEFPPNLIKFLRLCRKPHVPDMYKPFESPPMITHKDPGAAERHFKAAKELLGDWSISKKNQEDEQRQESEEDESEIKW